jgi:hypothetical protein
MFVDRGSRQIRFAPVEHGSRASHGACQGRAFPRGHAAKIDRHGQRGGLGVTDGSTRQSSDEGFYFIVAQAPAVAFLADDFLRKSQVRRRPVTYPMVISPGEGGFNGPRPAAGSRRRGTSSAIALRQLIRDMSLANPLWGAPRIHGEILKLGNRRWPNLGRQIHGKAQETSIPRLEDVRPQLRRWDRID